MIRKIKFIGANRLILWISPVLLCLFLCLCFNSNLPQKKIAVGPTNSLPAIFPSYFFFKSSLQFKALNPIKGLSYTGSYRVECWIAYRRQIHFIVKTSWGMEIIRGVIDDKGMTGVNRMSHTTYKWDYKKIKQCYYFDCDYPLIEALLLGTIEDTVSTGQNSSLVFTFDNTLGKVEKVQWMDRKKQNRFKISYKRKNFPSQSAHYLSALAIDFFIIDKALPYKGVITLNKLIYKAFSFKKPPKNFLGFKVKK